MKRVLAVFLVLLSASALSSFRTIQGGSAAIRFDSEMIDFGVVQQYTEQVRTFTFSNTGTAPLVIKEIRGQCGCTTFPGDWPKEPIAPGATASFKVKYDTQTRVGQFDKKIMVFCNASNAVNGFVEVKIKGNVIPATGN